MPAAPPEPAPPEPANTGRRLVYGIVAVLLLAPFVALLWVSSYAKDKPRLLGFPFFYWYQFLWVAISAVLTLVAYLLVHRVGRPRPRFEERERAPR